jgi:hypothetical protein
MLQAFSFVFGKSYGAKVNSELHFVSKRTEVRSRPSFVSVVGSVVANVAANIVPLLLCTIAAIGLTSCGSNGGMTTPPGPTKVTLLFTSTADDQYNNFMLFISSVTLTNKAGTTVTLFTNNATLTEGPEFIHVNGISEPLVSVDVPQDTYTSATVTANFVRLDFFTPDPPMPFEINNASLNTQTPIVNLTAPIQIKGTAMLLSLNLLEPQSVASNGGIATVTPTFSLAPLTLAATPTNDQNGLADMIEGKVTSVSTMGTSFGFLTAADNPLTISTNASTVFDGVSGFSVLTVNLLAVIDAAIQADGSLVATRIYVADPNAGDAQLGPIVDPPVKPGSSGEVNLLGVQLQGNELSTNPILLLQYQFASTTPFRTPGEFTNIQSLPFTATFSGSNLFVGQNLYVTTSVASFVTDPLTQASSVTLMPQTVNGTVNNVATIGSFQVFTVILQPNETLTVSTGATSVVVYVDSGTQMLNSAPIVTGSVIRFRGLLFNDGGTLRMDASQASDGVTN